METAYDTLISVSPATGTTLVKELNKDSLQ